MGSEVWNSDRAPSFSVSVALLLLLHDTITEVRERRQWKQQEIKLMPKGFQNGDNIDAKTHQ